MGIETALGGERTEAVERLGDLGVRAEVANGGEAAGGQGLERDVHGNPSSGERERAEVDAAVADVKAAARRQFGRRTAVAGARGLGPALAERRRRHAVALAESAREGLVGVVAGVERDCGDAGAGAAQALSGALHAQPPVQLERRLPD